MRKLTQLWSVSDLQRLFTQINFPEYQREPNVWSRSAKQRLVDSMLREFDISSLYFYKDEDGSLDCVDGRQRISAIMAFLGHSLEDVDNEFDLKSENEVYPEAEPPFAQLQGLRFREIEVLAQEATEPQHTEARALVEAFKGYRITVVELSGSSRPEEFSLQFTRLNLGAIINSGEKLHAMVGELRDACFGPDGLGQHGFLSMNNAPTRRFAREQTAAQILAQVFSLEENKGFTRTRHFDLQRLFKSHAVLQQERKDSIRHVRELMDLLVDAFNDPTILRSRALTVSSVLLAWRLRIGERGDAERLAQFMSEFICRLRWQVAKGLDVDGEYRYLIDFQRHVTQASVEAAAVDARARTLEEEYNRWVASGELRGDVDFGQRTGDDPKVECRK